MVQQVERLPEADRERLVEHMPTNPGMQRTRILVLAALNFLANSGTSEQAAALCSALQRDAST